MGLVFERAELNNFLGGANQQLEEKIIKLEALLNTYQDFIDIDTLKGAGWDSAKRLLGDALVPLARLEIEYAEEFMRANTRVVGFMDTDLVGVDRLDEDGLQQVIDTGRRKIREYEQQVADMVGLRSPAGSVLVSGVLKIADMLNVTMPLKNTLDQAEQQLAALHAFDDHVRGIYDTVKSCGDRLAMALSSLDGRGWDQARGLFATQGLDLGWVDAGRGYWRERESGSGEAFSGAVWYGPDAG